MLKIKVVEGESIDRAIKRYKRKHRNVKQLKEVRDRKHFTKKSVKKREKMKKAQYKEQYLRKDCEL